MIARPTRKTLSPSRPSPALLAVLLLLPFCGCTYVNRAIPVQSPPDRISRSGFVRPVSGQATSGFGIRTLMGRTRMHKGVDFHGTWLVTPVFAAKEGVVSVAAVSDTYGRWIEIRHGGGWATRYCHLTWRHVGEGDRVQRGDLIGRIGSSGTSTGPHLHFEVLQDGLQVDPMRVLPP